MKKKVCNLIVATLLAVALCSSFYYFTVASQRAETIERSFLGEVSFTIQRLEGYKESQEEAEFQTALSHIYCAYIQLGMMNQDLLIVQNSMSFHDLWNKGLFYPEEFKEDLDEIIQAMKLILGDSDFNDPNAAMALKMF